MSIAHNAKQDEAVLGTLYQFPDLPDVTTQRAYLEKTLETIREVVERFVERFAPKTAYAASRMLVEDLQLFEEHHSELNAELIASLRLRDQFENAARRGDARETGW